MNTVQSIGETALIERLVGRLANGRDVIVGPGDDCAVVRAGAEDWLLTSDPVIEGIHFTPDAKPEHVGHKAIARALSDIAAMGGAPRWALVDLVAPDTTDSARIEAIYDGMAATAATLDLAVVGGDVARGPALELHIFAVGSVPRGQAVLRSGTRPGDAIFVTGALGGSRVSEHHLTFTPRLREGQWLCEGNWASSMCDVSDGLSTDLHHITAASGVGAELQVAGIPCSEAIRGSSDPITHALKDGEDFELLFTVPPDKHNAFIAAWLEAHALACTCIGTVTAGHAIEGVAADGNRTTLVAAGYDHFSGGARSS
ncbi:MAG: thiamine-phosphate kinase [Kiritimatiellia bacterium]|jgi:thiamine-monophosphate kinase|nr:thiamine-phosphate kinase [Kiritimatiellia bacterium]MDP6630211.1 thiamine-phosphate kinase [Kiritimatiellia bacterium]MDP6810701.1 thiamine-phosphate kinase [Kiritimatiellia bacterium]MDP7023312.1 thiamine-phosphate kinase [Kiritimatiellia bacterium]